MFFSISQKNLIKAIVPSIILTAIEKTLIKDIEV
jgi:hypothetical protein